MHLSTLSRAAKLFDRSGAFLLLPQAGRRQDFANPGLRCRSRPGLQARSRGAGRAPGMRGFVKAALRHKHSHPNPLPPAGEGAKYKCTGLAKKFLRICL